ncbi:hypothetical protein WN944_027712 [Citrus x changshan-huyou]|uniref:Uncharacterized protein n=1 Tax=Citrus x changshan-huyou TaxID=2935761 RepID=A0AAP0LLD7_9ROSI
MMYAKQGPGVASTNFLVYPTLYQRALQVYQAPNFRHGGMIPNGFVPSLPPLPLEWAGQTAANNLTNGSQRATASNDNLISAKGQRQFIPDRMIIFS